MSDIEKLKSSVQDFCQSRNWDQFHGPKELAIGLVTESSELLDLFRFKNDNECLEVLLNKSPELKSELADIFFMLLRFSQKYDFDLEQCLYEKMKKNESRYPIEKCYGSNKKYNELD